MRCAVGLFLVALASVACLELSQQQPDHKNLLSSELANLEDDLVKLVDFRDLENLDDPLDLVSTSSYDASRDPTGFQKTLLYLSLFFAEKINGKVRAVPGIEHQDNFENLSSDEKLLLGRMLWIGSQLAYDKNNFYRRHDNTREEINVPHVIDRVVEGNSPVLADARAVIVLPGDYLVPISGGKFSSPSKWFCGKAGHSKEFCQSAKMIHVPFRGMQLSWRLTTPPRNDLVNMRGLTKLVECSFNIPTDLTDSNQIISVSITITQGTCKLLTSLVEPQYREGPGGWRAVPKSGLFDILLPMVNEAMQDGNVLVYFQGLSFGGALAQAVGTLFAQIINTALHGDSALARIRASVVTFGSPRIASNEFATTTHSIINSGFMTSDQFIMYTYFKNSRSTLRAVTDTLRITSRAFRLFYDPIAMWPPEHRTTGRQHTLLYFSTATELVTEVLQDMFDSKRDTYNVVAGRSSFLPKDRKVPVSSLETFYCLHLFPLYKNFFEEKASPRNWCKGNNPVSTTDLGVSISDLTTATKRSVLRDEFGPVALRQVDVVTQIDDVEELETTGVEQIAD